LSVVGPIATKDGAAAGLFVIFRERSLGIVIPEAERSEAVRDPESTMREYSAILDPGSRASPSPGMITWN